MYNSNSLLFDFFIIIETLSFGLKPFLLEFILFFFGGNLNLFIELMFNFIEKVEAFQCNFFLRMAELISSIKATLNLIVPMIRR